MITLNTNRWAHGMMLLASLLIATSFPVVASIAGTMDSLILALLRFVLASLLFLPLVVWRYRTEVIPSGVSLIRYAALSAPLVGFFYAMFEALRTTTAINTGALFTFVPSFAALFTLLILGERLAGRRLVALGTGMVGAMWVVFRGEFSRFMALELVPGDAVFLAGTASLGLYAVLVKRLHRGEPMAVMTFWTLVTGSGWLLVLGWDALSAVRWHAIEPLVFSAIVYLAIFTTLVTFLLTQKAVALIGPTQTMAYNYLNPTLVALLVWALGDGVFGWMVVPGVGLTLISMAVLQRENRSLPTSISLPHPGVRATPIASSRTISTSNGPLVQGE
jgi:drug/metabolite transporter (DMT)-like permease